MYIDQNLEFSDAQAVTVTAISTNVYDTLSMGAGGSATAIGPNTSLDLGQSNEPLYLVVQTAVTCTDVSSDATLTISLESDSTANLATSATVHFTTAALAFAAYATAGTRLITIALPSGAYERYLGVRYTIASGPLTAGAFDAFLTTNPPGPYRVLASGFAVS